MMTFEEFVETLDFQTGSVNIAGDAVTFDLPEGWAMLKGRDARRVVEDVWGNPEDHSTIAFIDPPSEEGRLGAAFGVIVTMDKSGFVSDDDAAGLDYSALLSDMQASAKQENLDRAEMGYQSIDILGWAEPPHYDQKTKKLYWAKELKFGQEPDRVLNYDVRILGRRGYLQLQAVSTMGDRDAVDEGMKALLPVTHFNEGHRYSDFDESTDNIAAYGIGGLIAGKMAAKVGFFAVIAKFGKLIVFGAIGMFVAAKKFLFGRSKDVGDAVYEDEEEPVEA